MNGPDHYAEAERLLDSNQHTSFGNQIDVLTALAHAALALVAASAENDATEGRAQAEIQRWVQAGALEPYGPAS